ncbi:polysaccharide deacetylase family protein [Aliifodinibius sp. S!AR15-10]|uniref:polysaccharide deacetylase family protein n=1 Tax=Aliifodinibius sp. S!AR15-10 TaxID=2950437 RepID=UPI00285BB4F6|nr:polysaccharide deacetylase family protein [Aliifodinibius sp. S!AR15-10]MDR8393456.1 polysaccharide deacetylase family protein [Aliifodinibius sp. S!AR15-10]
MHFTTLNKQLLSLLFLFLPISVTQAQDNSLWHNKKAAVALTYDDALEAQLDNAVPLLDSLNLKVTFYLTGHFPGFRQHIDRWRAVAEKGHDLGNHTLFHPCKGDAPGREWVQPENDLNRYTMVRMLNEITMTNVLLKAVDGRSHRTFAYPCGDTAVGDSSYINQINEHFIGRAAYKVQRQQSIR